MAHAQPRRGPRPFRRLALSPYLLLAASSLFWAGNFVVGRAIRGDIGPIALNFWRWTLALALLLPLGAPLLPRHAAVLRREWRLVVALGVTGIAGFQTFVYHALTMTTALNALLIVTLTPVVIVALMRLFFGERLSAVQGAGVIVSLLGAVVVIARGDLLALGAIRFNAGDLWLLGAVLLWAIYSILLKRRPADLPLLPLLVACILVGLSVLLPLYGWRLAAGETFQLNRGTLLVLLYVGIFPSAVAFTCWNRGVIEVGPNVAGMFLHLMPIFGAALAVLFLGERIAAYHWAGALLVFGGIVLASRRARPH